MRSNERSVVVGVLTYRRLEMLSTLLRMLEEQSEAVDQTTWTVSTLVVDNDADGSARDLVTSRYPSVHYEVEPVPGIARARNRALDAAADLGAQVLVFIDDDEEPEPGWLTSLLATYEHCDCAAVVGRVVSRFEGAPDPWLIEGGFFRRAHRLGLRTGDTVASAATNNLLLDLAIVGDLGLRFEETLGAAGGEDTRFTLQLTAGHGRIVWCEEAVVVDVVTPERATRKVAVRRVFSAASGSIAAIVASQETPRARARSIARFTATGLGRLGIGAVQTVAGTVARRQRWQARGVGRMARGAGALLGITGRSYAEYRRQDA